MRIPFSPAFILSFHEKTFGSSFSAATYQPFIGSRAYHQSFC
jgi:hypothetical protein